MKAKLFQVILPAILCGAAITAQAAVVHESDFDETTGTDPITAGDVTAINATGGSLVGHANGYYTYPGDGTLLFRHPGHEWDDSGFTMDSTGLVGPAADIEYEFDFDTNSITTAGVNATVEILLTNPGQSDGDSKTNADAILWFQTDGGSGVFIGFGPGGANPALTGLTTTADNINDVKVIINHDGTDWRAFYSINGGSLLEAPNSPMTAARATTAIRVECDNTPWAGTMDSWELIAKNLKIHDTVETTAAVLVPGEVLNIADFNETAGAVGTNGHFYPIGAEGLAGMYIDTGAGATQEYDGDAWVIGHDGDNGDNWNATIATVEDGSEPAEWVVDIKPQFATDGEYQMFNFKVDGAGGSMYLANDTGNSGNIFLIFGEETNIFAPDPGNVATLANTASTLTDLKLIINYDPLTTEYHGFFVENGGSVIPHPGNPLVKARTDGNVEFQWQCWKSGGSTAFSVGLDNYEEQYGISTIDSSGIEDFTIFE